MNLARTYGKRVRALDRHDEVACRNRLGQLGEGGRARRGRAAVALDTLLLDDARARADRELDRAGARLSAHLAGAERVAA